MNQEFDKDKTEKGFEESGREGYRKPAFNREYSSEGRPQRPRTRIVRPQYGSDRPRYSNNNEGSFRPEGFGSAFHDNAQQGERRPYGQRPRFNGGNGGSSNYNRNGYNRGGYGQQNSYNNQQGGYRPRYNNNNEGEMKEGGFQPRPRYNNNGGYDRQGGYNRGGYNRGGYGQQGGFSRGGYTNQQGGNFRRPRTSDYDPNAKYSHKKRIEYSEAHIDPNAPIRLNKYLANAGICSRREADDFIQAGLVTVNGNVVTELGTRVLRSDKIVFHDQPVSIEKKVYVLLNKPKDYVTTSDDPQNRKTVMDLVKDACPERIYPVGRLDRNTTGVLLLTNDGEMASKLTHPRFLKKKVYHVFCDKNVTAHDINKIAEGIELEDGLIKADAVDYASPTDKKQVGIEIHSGKNRIVRRIFESLGYRVIKLDRVQFAGLTKKNLRRGDWRFLTEKEVDMLRMGACE
ncbi:pseudouridine synthase [Prevotella sp. PINT]|jgi:pseudouridine synthase|uniref:pseudouridine synthase n=1 Tax=Palleniella intestinalis TaxID=2736291 RepID=UPI001551C696|nr:pseudouridine synthase [Palleniella intestinalis]NPD82096.1 pseudouridine synthase [Palleniella intestinalis]